MSNRPPGDNPPRRPRTSKAKLCSFCGRNAREVGPLVEGPEGVQICANCVDLCQTLVRQERRRMARMHPMFESIPPPREIKEYLDRQANDPAGGLRRGQDLRQWIQQQFGVLYSLPGIYDLLPGTEFD